MNVRIGASQTPQSEPDRSQPSDSDLPRPFRAETPEEISLQLVPKGLFEDIRQRLVLSDALDKVSGRHWHRTIVVGID